MRRTLTIVTAGLLAAAFQHSPVHADGVPEFKVDPFWPKPLPENWMLGQVAGIAVDSRTTSGSCTGRARWSTTRRARRTLRPRRECCKPAPPVLQFDARRQPAQELGRPGRGLRLAQDRARHPRRPARATSGSPATARTTTRS